MLLYHVNNVAVFARRWLAIRLFPVERRARGVWGRGVLRHDLVKDINALLERLWIIAKGVHQRSDCWDFSITSLSSSGGRAALTFLDEEMLSPCSWAGTTDSGVCGHCWREEEGG